MAHSHLTCHILSAQKPWVASGYLLREYKFGSIPINLQTEIASIRKGDRGERKTGLYFIFTFYSA